MKKLTKYLNGYIKECILGPLFKLLEATLELIVPLIVALIVDNGIKDLTNANTGFIAAMCAVLVILGAVGLFFSVIAQYYAAKASCGFIGKVRRALFSHIQTLSYTELDTIGTPTLITRMTTDANQVQTGLNLTLRLLLRSPFVVFGALIMAFTIDFESALSFAAVIPLLSIVIFGIMLFSMPLHKKVQKRLDSVLSTTSENLYGARVIRAFCMEKSETAKFKRRNADLTHSQKFVGRISALLNPLTFVLINFATITLIYTGAIQVDKTGLTQGQVIALYNYMAQILVELVKLANLIISITKALASAARISEVMDTKCSMKNGERKFDSLTDGIVFDKVSFAYNTASENSIENISFNARVGQTIGIIGGTGAGKSTLVNLIPRFYDATEGKIFINGIDIKEYDAESYREKIGIVPQKAVMFSGSIRENLRWGNGAATDEEMLEAIKLAQCEDFVNEKGGLDALISQGGKNLSGGQRQRLTIARALVRKPEILILDDSSSALDYATDAKLRAALRNIGDRSLVFIVSQRTSSVMHADLIIVLEDGYATGMGTHDELLRSCDVYKEIYDTQFGGGNGNEK